LKKSVDTLVEDIYSLFQTGHVPDEALVGSFGSQLATTVAERLRDYGVVRTPTLRMSNLGKPDRQLWYELHLEEGKETLQPHTKLKFLIGDIYESVLLFLAKCAGHEVTDEQAEVSVDGIVGHIDARIDGTVVDVKSASTYAFKKFKDGTLAEDDPFGYIEQISGYATAYDTDGAFLAGDKQNGHLALLKVPKEDVQALDIQGRIAHIKEVVAHTDPPERCYEPEPYGQSGNQVLGVSCSYCPFKQHCWSDSNDGMGLRTFLYSKGPVHFTHVEKEPNVLELTF
jgi:hypothetical protein